MKRILFILFFISTIIILLMRCNNSSSKSDTSKKVVTTSINIAKSSKKEESVSIIKLIANPEEYDQKLVRIKGYLNLVFEGNAIYLFKDDCDFGIDKNGLWIDFENSKIASSYYNRFNKRYVILEGTFLRSNRGHQDGYSGAITKITRINALGE